MPLARVPPISTHASDIPDWQFGGECTIKSICLLMLSKYSVQCSEDKLIAWLLCHYEDEAKQNLTQLSTCSNITRMINLWSAIMRVRLSRTSCICLTGTLLFLLPLLMGYYLYHLVTNTISNIMHRFNSEGMDILGEIPGLRQLIQNGQNGGFIKLQQNTLERLFIVTHHAKNTHNGTNLDSSVSFLGLDVSHSLEASYIYRRILSSRSFPFTRLIVDIGANDGFLSSNSFNFIQWGWNAVLVEPQHDKIRSAKINTKR